MDERMMIDRAVKGDKEAFAELYLLYRDSLYRYAYFKLGDPQFAQDAVSACIVSAYEGIMSLRYAAAFKGWIFKILYRCCCKQIEEQAAERVRADAEELDRLSAEPDTLSPELKEAFGVLSPEDRDIILLSVLAGYNSREIAGITGFKANTVRSRLARGLKKMREFLE